MVYLTGTEGDEAQKDNLRYLNEFIRMKCTPDLLQLNLFPNVKEITETMGMWMAAKTYIDLELNSSESQTENAIIVVGDGCTPRTAAVFAFLSKNWKCYSVDPALRVVANDNDSDATIEIQDIDNLILVSKKIQQVRFKANKVILVLMHAHVTLADCLKVIDTQELVGAIVCPCCNNYESQKSIFGNPPNHTYFDAGILSDHNQVRVWVKPEKSFSVVKPVIVDSPLSESGSTANRESETFKSITLSWPASFNSRLASSDKCYDSFLKQVVENLKEFSELFKLGLHNSPTDERESKQVVAVVLYVQDSNDLVGKISKIMQDVLSMFQLKVHCLRMVKDESVINTETIESLKHTVNIIVDIEALCTLVANHRRRQRFSVVKTFGNRVLELLLSQKSKSMLLILSPDSYYRGALLRGFPSRSGDIDWKGKYRLDNAKTDENRHIGADDIDSFYCYCMVLHETCVGTEYSPIQNLYKAPDDAVTIPWVWHNLFRPDMLGITEKTPVSLSSPGKEYTIVGLVTKVNSRRNYFQVFDDAISYQQRYSAEWAKCWPCLAQRGELSYINEDEEKSQSSKDLPQLSRPACIQVFSRIRMKSVRKGDTIEISGIIGLLSNNRFGMVAYSANIVRKFSDNLILDFPFESEKA